MEPGWRVITHFIIASSTNNRCTQARTQPPLIYRINLLNRKLISIAGGIVRCTGAAHNRAIISRRVAAAANRSAPPGLALSTTPLDDLRCNAYTRPIQSGLLVADVSISISLPITLTVMHKSMEIGSTIVTAIRRQQNFYYWLGQESRFSSTNWAYFIHSWRTSGMSGTVIRKE